MNQMLVNQIAISGNTTLGYTDVSVVVINNLSFGEPLHYAVKPINSVIGMRKQGAVVNWDPNI